MPAVPSDPELRTAPSHVAGGAVASTPIVSDVDPAALVSIGALAAAEAALAASLPPSRRASFVAGRIALRAAVRRVSDQHAGEPFLRTPRGRPVLPEGVLGSVSHKRTRAVAIAAPQSAPSGTAHVGIDLEHRPVPADLGRPSIAPRILTERELHALDARFQRPSLAHRDATLLRFALKEAVYKAIDPWVERYVRFTEVELEVHGESDDDDASLTGFPTHGTASVRLLLPETDSAPVHVHAAWERDNEWIIATTSSYRRV